MKTIIWLIVTVSSSMLWAQGKPIRGQESAWPPVSGKATFILTPAPKTEPESLRQLSDKSVAIMDGFVMSTSVRQMTAVRRLETDVVFQPTRILKGLSSPSTTTPLSTIVITQRGGRVGEYEEQPIQFSLMKPGERYLLFTIDDNRPTIPTVPGNKRYLITGEWIGNFRLDPDNTVHLNSGVPDSFKTQYEGTTQDQLFNALIAILGQGTN